MKSGIRETDILREIEQASRKAGAQGMTTRELAEYTGKSIKQVLRLLRIALEAGKMQVARSLRPRIDGILSPTPVYLPTRKKK